MNVVQMVSMHVYVKIDGKEKVRSGEEQIDSAVGAKHLNRQGHLSWLATCGYRPE